MRTPPQNVSGAASAKVIPGSVLAKPPRFSIITVTLNNLEGLRDTQSSIVSQNAANYEWLVIDGASNDGTVAYLNSIEHRNFGWISESDHGLYDAMNKGLERAVGDYVIFMNAGDKFAGPDVLARIAAVVDGGGKWDLLFGDACEETAEGKLLLKSSRPLSAIRYGMFTHHQAIFYSRAAVADMRYDRSFQIAGDYDFTCRLLRTGARSCYVGFAVSINKRGGLSEQHVEIGGREKLVVQKQVLKLNLVQRLSNYMLFRISHLMRTHMRDFYDLLRYSRQAPTRRTS